MPAPQKTRAHAKLNLGLKIFGSRPDGYHDLRTVYQTISLADTVAIASGGPGTRLELTAEPGCEAPTGASNLALRAAEAAREAWGIRTGLTITLHKRIPVGAGLGGGSSDAAAVLRLLARLPRRPPTFEAQLRLAAQLGSDVPLFLIGGTVLGVGRGEEVYPLPDLPSLPGIVALPRGNAGAIATTAAFRLWDTRRPTLTPAGPSVTMERFCSWLVQLPPAFRFVRNRGAGYPAAPRVQAGIENDFSEVVFSLSPDFARIQAELRRSGARLHGLSGSGAAQFGFFADAATASRAAQRLGVSYRVWTMRMVSRRASLSLAGALGLGRRPMAGHMPLTHGI